MLNKPCERAAEIIHTHSCSGRFGRSYPSHLVIPDSLRQRLERTGVVAVLVIDDPVDAVPVARALLAGGVDCLELTLRTPAAFEALMRIRAELPELERFDRTVGQ